MSPIIADWLIFALGMIGLGIAVGIHRGQSKARRAGTSLDPKVLGGFSIVVGCILAMDEFVRLRAKDQVLPMVVGFVVGGTLGAIYARSWVKRRIAEGESSGPRHPSPSGWLQSWRIQALLIVIVLLVWTIGSRRLAFVSDYSTLWAGISQGLAGLFVVFGMYVSL